MRHLLFFFSLIIFVPFCHAKPTVAVLHTKQKEIFQHQVVYYAKLFDFDSSVHIIVSFRNDMKQHQEGYTIFNKTNGITQIYIRIRSNLNMTKKQLVLAHEMIHAKQFINKELQHVEKFCYVWKGKTFRDIRDVAYSNRLWEREAFLHANTIFSQYLKQKRRINVVRYLAKARN